MLNIYLLIQFIVSLLKKVLIKTIYLYNSYFLSSNLIGWEEWDSQVISELQPFHSICSIYF